MAACLLVFISLLFFGFCANPQVGILFGLIIRGKYNALAAELAPVVHVVVFVALVFPGAPVILATHPHGSVLTVAQAEKLAQGQLSDFRLLHNSVVLVIVLPD